jgi:DNA-binding IclR family transcriptional regulator
MTDEPRRIHAAENVFGIFEFLVENETATLGELAEELGLTKSTLHTYLATMTGRGFVQQQGNRYELTYKFLRYGELLRQNTGIISEVRDGLQKAINRTNGISWFIVEEEGHAVFVENAKNVDAVQPYGSVGKRTHLHHIAGGKAILAHLPEERVEEIIGEHGLPATTDRTISDRESLYEHLDLIRDRGYALNDGENVDGWRAVSSPVLYKGTVLGAVAISEPKHQMTDERFTETIPETVQAVTNDIQLKSRSA